MKTGQNVTDFQQRFISLSQKFRECVQSVNASAVTVTTEKETGATAKLCIQNLIARRADLIQKEADGLLDISSLSHERVSLLARFRQPIFGDDVAMTVKEIEDSLEQGAAAENFSAARLNSLTGVPEANVERGNELKEKVRAASNESQRLLTALMGPPLPPEEVAAFHSIYLSPADPLSAFSANSGRLAETYLSLTETSFDRAENVMTYVGAIDTVMKPLFPDQTDFLTEQQKISLRETQEALTTGAGYLRRAELYGAKPTPG